MTCTDWIPLDPTRLARPRAEPEGNGTVMVAPAPSDLPLAFRLLVPGKRGKFALEFMYLDGDGSEKALPASEFVFVLDSEMGRLRRIEFLKPPQFSSEKDQFSSQFRTLLDSAMKALASGFQDSSRTNENYRVVKGVVEEDRNARNRLETSAMPLAMAL
jgi:hypothetical protein